MFPATPPSGLLSKIIEHHVLKIRNLKSARERLYSYNDFRSMIEAHTLNDKIAELEANLEELRDRHANKVRVIEKRIERNG